MKKKTHLRLEIFVLLLKKLGLAVVMFDFSIEAFSL
jgi:hypothetical protein